MRISVIVPTRRCTPGVALRVQHTHLRLPDAQIVVVEPASESSDTGNGCSAPSLPDGTLIIEAPRGRGTQCNGGARVATGDILLFLHDDTLLPDSAARATR